MNNETGVNWYGAQKSMEENSTSITEAYRKLESENKRLREALEKLNLKHGDAYENAYNALAWGNGEECLTELSEMGDIIQQTLEATK